MSINGLDDPSNHESPDMFYLSLKSGSFFLILFIIILIYLNSVISTALYLLTSIVIIKKAIQTKQLRCLGNTSLPVSIRFQIRDHFNHQ